THPAWTAVKNFFSLQRQSGACAFRVKLSTSYRNVVREVGVTRRRVAEGSRVTLVANATIY
ncbi:hypothetical protein, partial [Jiella sp. M17.18]|uniref:hypothetical protein n=1 Tax=Jiella sp. M17.18 TaxID=3234247 RepID=UPI0034DECD84